MEKNNRKTNMIRTNCPFCGSKNFELAEYDPAESYICNDCLYRVPKEYTKWERGMTRLDIIGGAVLGSFIMICIWMIVENYHG